MCSYCTWSMLYLEVVLVLGTDDGLFTLHSSQLCQWLVSLVLQVSLDLRDLLALLAPQVRALKVLKDPRDLLALPELLAVPSLANLDPQVDLANLAAMEHLVRRETPEPLALRDQEEPPDPLEALDPLASPLLANLDLQVFPAQWDPEESLV